MELADDIAYGVHDIEDIVARRLATRDEVTDQLKTAFAAVGGTLDTTAGLLDADVVGSSLFADSYHRKQMIGRLVNTFMTPAIIIEQVRFSHPILRFRASLPATHKQLLNHIRDMSHGLVINKPGVQQLERRGTRVVNELFCALMEDPARLIHGFSQEGLECAD